MKFLKYLFRLIYPVVTYGWVIQCPIGIQNGWHPAYLRHHNGVPVGSGWFIDMYGGFPSKQEAQETCDQLNNFYEKGQL